MAKRIQSCLLIGAVGLLAVACAQDVPTAADSRAAITPLGPQFFESSAFNSAGQCMGNDAVELAGGTLVSGMSDKTDPNAFVCEAKEVFIATATVTQVFDPEANSGNGAFVPYDAANPPQCVEGGSITFKMTALLEQHAGSERADIGVWIATDGGNAKSGLCNQYNVPTNATGIGVVNGDGDQCAGLANDGQVGIDLGELTVPCNPDPVTNKLSVGSCIGWKVPSDGDDASCADNKDGVLPAGTADDFRAATLPVNKTKCNCEPFLLDIVVLKKATIEVKKTCSPTNDNGTFDLEIDDVVNKNDATCAGGTASTTGTVEVGAGTSANPGADHTVAESGFTFANYTSTVSCTKNGAAYIASAAYTPDNNLNVHVEPNDAVVCTFVNTRKSGITIVKDAVPNDAQDFTFTTAGTGLAGFDLDDDGDNANTLSNTKSFTNLVPGGVRTITETALTGWTLTNISCSGATNSTVAKKGSGGGGDDNNFQAGDNRVDITLAAGETVTCTFENTKKGTVKITKVTDPAPNTTDSFGFTDTGLTPTSFSLKNGETRTFTDVLPNTGTGYPVIEDDPKPGFDLTNISCTNPDGLNASTTDVPTRKATVKVNPGETVECTFTNRQRAKVQVNKTQSGLAPAAGAFSFEIRFGASLTSLGTVIATGTNDAQGVVTFSCNGGDPTKCTNDANSLAYFVPGSYQFCEVNMLPGWANNIAGFTPNITNDPLADNSDECVAITLGAGGSGVPAGVPNPIDNTPPPGGDARTIGFWKTHSCEAPGRQADVLSLWLPVSVGIGYADNSDFILGVNDCHSAVALLDKRNITSGKKSASDAAYNLASQLIAALLNVNANAGTCNGAITTYIQQAQVLLDRINFNGTTSYLTKSNTTDYALANSLAKTLDNYNNNICPAP